LIELDRDDRAGAYVGHAPATGSREKLHPDLKISMFHAVDFDSSGIRRGAGNWRVRVGTAASSGIGLPAPRRLDTRGQRIRCGRRLRQNAFFEIALDFNQPRLGQQAHGVSMRRPAVKAVELVFRGLAMSDHHV
jgi:hypothetical protein